MGSSFVNNAHQWGSSLPQIKKILAPVKCQLEPDVTELIDTELESRLFLEAVPPSVLFQNPKEPGGKLVIDLELILRELQFRNPPSYIALLEDKTVLVDADNPVLRAGN